jgi:flavin reductase (DIM6/NTAB) family NADH-FMN oxidoreductase RutF
MNLMKKRIIDPKKVSTKDLHQYLLGSVAPRPIAFVSTKDKEGRDNIAPYSFFNAFSSNPPILVFSSNRRVRDNTTKDTLQNIIDTKEAVINVVNYNIVRQMAMTSVEFPTGTSEFEKSELTPVASELVKPCLVKESPVNMEVKVNEVITLGDHGGAGHLIICEVLRMHIDESVLDGDRIDPHKIDLMGRMGRSYYVRASGDAIKTIYQSVTDIPIGYDALPANIRASNILTANDIATLASQPNLPESLLLDENEVSGLSQSDIHLKIQSYIKDGHIDQALLLALNEK